MASSGHRELTKEAALGRAILLPYQRRWVSDPSPIKIWLAARQVGKSFSLAMEAVTEALERKCDNLILSASERQSGEVMHKVYGHLRYLRVASEDIIRAERESRQEVTLPTGSRVISLPANPDTVRGFSGNVYLDEFAFHRDAREIWRAMYPAVARGYRVRITSTPNGMHNLFHELWAGGGDGISRHRTDIHEAKREGLAVDIPRLRKGILDADSWSQEFECVFLDEATAFITYGMIASCEDAACEDATKEIDSSLLLSSDRGRRGEGNTELYLGVDVGRKKDLTVFWLLEKAGDVCWTRMVRELDRVPFRMQRDFLYSLLGGSVRRCCIDASGIGMQLAEETIERFGPRVEAVAFTAQAKEDLALTLRRKFEERSLRIPPDRAIRQDIHSVRKYVTSSGNARFDAKRAGGSHADRFWALALAVHASSAAGYQEVYYESAGGRRIPAEWLKSGAGQLIYSGI